MEFSSLEFLFRFLPIFLIIYYLVPVKYKNPVLFFGSLVFYAMGNWKDALLLLFSMSLNYILVLLMDHISRKSSRNSMLVILLCYNIGLLCIFKYTRLSLPLGISFYTFTMLSYVLDVYKKKTAALRDYLEYGTYILLFPKLISGPIAQFANMAGQLKKHPIRLEKIEHGLTLFIIGLGYKVIIANHLAILWRDIQGIGFESISTPLAWMGAFGYSAQLFFDFQGYSLMAIGLGRMMGFDFPQNFNNPYMAVSMTDFWRRWHMTLGGWFREYVYIPLGGNRGGFAKTVRNMFVVWLLTGLWHGASWNFVLWGLLLFVLLFVEKAGLGKVLERHKVLGHIYMILWIPLSWLVFVITDLSQLGIYLQKLFPFFGSTGTVLFQGDYLKYGKTYGIYLVLGILFATGVQEKLLKKNKNRLWVILLLLALFWASVYCMYLGMDDPFLYFRF